MISVLLFALLECICGGFRVGHVLVMTGDCLLGLAVIPSTLHRPGPHLVLNRLVHHLTDHVLDLLHLLELGLGCLDRGIWKREGDRDIVNFVGVRK